MNGGQVVVVGAGMGGLTAALRLRRAGFRVRVLEARAQAGGLAAGFAVDGFSFDAGPYILLDRPGLEWAFRAVGLEVSDLLDLRRLDDVYEVTWEDGPPALFRASLAETASGFDRAWPGSGPRYLRFVAAMTGAYRRLQPMLRVSRPGALTLLRAGGWRDVPLLLRSLRRVLALSGLPPRLVEALGIWTHVAGQDLDQAPSLLAFVPALIHDVGAFYPRGGVGAVPRVLALAAQAAGVEIEHGAEVRRIVSRDGRVRGVETADGALREADAVVSDANGIGTYLDLTPATPPRAREALRRLPLQSPGVCAYVAARGDLAPPYLRFRLPPDGGLCRLWIRPAVPEPALQRTGWWPARLLSPMRHAEAENGGPGHQRDYLDRVVAETWWREGLDDVRVLATRVPAEWGAEYRLHRDSMNPVMTARLMRKGRLPHRSPHVKGLYLAGSATHPGQWVSFCAISGVLAADCVRQDLG